MAERTVKTWTPNETQRLLEVLRHPMVYLKGHRTRHCRPSRLVLQCLSQQGLVITEDSEVKVNLVCDAVIGAVTKNWKVYKLANANLD